MELLRLGYRVRYCVGRVNLDNGTLVSCGGVLYSWCVGGGGECSFVGIDVSLVEVMAARRSLRRIFSLILVVLVLPGSLVSCVLHFDYCILRFTKSDLLKFYEQIYLLVSLNITSLEEESTPGKYPFKLHKYLFITNFRLVRNGFILI